MASRTTRFENLLEAVPDALVGMDQKGVIRFVNRQTESLFSYDRDDLVGEPIETLLPETLWQIYASHQEEYFADPRTRSSGLDLELSGRHHDGTEFPANISMSHIDTGDVLLVITAVDDVARQKRAVRKAELITSIVEYSDDAIIGGTLEGVVTSWNPAAERMYGYSSLEMIGRSGRVLAPQDGVGEFFDNLATVKHGQVVEHVETTRVRKDGSTVPVSLTMAPIRDENGRIDGVSHVHQDVTELKHAALYARSLIEAALDPMLTISPEGKIDDVNEATVKVTGVPRHTLLGTDFSHYFTDPDKALGGYRRAFEKGSVTDYPLTVVHRDGTLTDVLYNASVYRDTAGDVLGVFAAARDMTTQKEAFEAAQRMAAIVEYSDDAIVGSTLEGIITSWNPAAERMYGYSSDTIAGRSVDLLGPQERTGEIRSVLVKIKAGRPVENFETVCTRKDGTRFPVKLTIAPIRNADGAVVGASAIARDVTEERRALAAAQQMVAIVEFSGEAIISTTIEGVVMSWNPAAERMYGYSGQEIIGRSGSLLSPEDRSGEITSILSRVQDGEAVQDFETISLRKDQTPVPVSLTVTPIRSPHGAIVGTSVIARDLTGHR